MPGTTQASIEPTVRASQAAAEANPGGSSREVLLYGTTIGRYVILNVIGRGGMGVVYAAHDPQLDRQVALKLLSTEDGAEEAERLVREAKALAKLDDPHVVQVFDAGEVDGKVFVAMQLVDGEDLGAALVKRRRREDVPQILSWFMDAGRGLAAAHAARLVHRDFKPSNVLIDRRGRVAVTDFGIARERGKTHDPERGKLSGADRLIGTPAYMAPEQHALDKATEASDQFSYCVSLWEAVFDQHPFVAGDRSNVSAVEIGIAIFEGKIISPKSRRGAPRRVQEALERGLSRDPGNRWPSMTALLTELQLATRRPKWIYGAGAALLVVGAAAAAFAVWPRGAHGGGPTGTCDADTRLASVWNADKRADLMTRLAATGFGYSERAATSIVDRIDTYGQQWRAGAIDACRDTDEERRAMRQTCLSARLAEMTGLVGGLTNGAAGRAEAILHFGPGSVGYLGPVESCETHSEWPASDPDDTKVLDVYKRLGEAVSLYATGEPANAERELDALEKTALGPSLAAAHVRALLLLGRIEVDQDRGGRDHLLDAGQSALELGLDGEAAQAFTALLEVAQPAEVDALAITARTSARRIGSKELIVRAYVNEALTLEGDGRNDEAYKLCAPARSARVAGWQAVDVASCYAHTSPPNYDPDVDMARTLDYVTAVEKVLGEGHPRSWEAMALRSQALRDIAHDPGQALRVAQQALALASKVLPPEHRYMSLCLQLVGELLIRNSRVAEGTELLTKALAIADKHADVHPLSAARLHLRIGDLAAGASRDQAIAHARAAVALDQSENIIVLAAVLAARVADWDDAMRYADTAQTTIAKPTTVHRGLVFWVQARVIEATRGEGDKARELARQARDILAATDERVFLAKAQTLADIDAWLAKR